MEKANPIHTARCRYASAQQMQRARKQTCKLLIHQGQKETESEISKVG